MIRGRQWLSGKVVDLEIERSLVRNSLEALCCILDQDTLYAAEYWFNLENCPNMTEKPLTELKESTQTKNVDDKIAINFKMI